MSAERPVREAGAALEIVYGRSVRFGILGPLEVTREGREVRIGAAKQRALLTLLLLRRGELVPTGKLIHDLWGEHAPATAVKTLQVYVSQLRKLLDAGILETRPGGYVLRLAPDALDAARFEMLLGRGRALLADGQAASADAVLGEALALWRGPALAELRYDEYARDETARLEELRLVARESRLEIDLTLGRHQEAVPRLETLVREHPLRERPRELLMLALYRSGRQADALAAYRDADATLRDELGLLPGQPLQQLEKAILNHDSALDVRTPSRSPGLQPADASTRTSGTNTVRPVTRYAKSGDVHIAYQVVGSGPIDLVYVPGWISHVELAWELSDLARGFERLASFSRLILFDKRGTGMSDPVPDHDLPGLETRMDDVRAVMDAVGSERAAIFGASEGGNMSMLYAATYPQRTIALATFGCTAKRVWSPDYPWAPTPEERQAAFAHTERYWTESHLWADLAPSLDAAGTAEISRYYRRCATPGAAVGLMRMNTDVDVRGILPAISSPTVVMHRSEDRDANVAEGRYIASQIPDARFVEFQGADHSWWTQGCDAILDEIEELVTGVRPVPEPTRVLATVLFTDIVGATDRARELGDRRWAELLERHHRAVRREVERFGGRELDTAGDGFLAAFEGPARAVRCAVAARHAVGELGLELRSGVHTGECELLESKLTGIAVHTGARVAALARPGEVLVSATVRDLVSGSGIAFDDRGVHELKGVGERNLFAVAGI